MTALNKTKKLVFLSLLIALAVVLHVIENTYLPALTPIPGGKLGLSNMMTLTVLYTMGRKDACILVGFRIILASFLGGFLFTPKFFIGLSGSLLSLILMIVIHFFLKDNIIITSVVGAIAHNAGQLMMAAFLVHHIAIFYYLPYLLLISIPAGIFTGYAAKYLQGYLLKHIAVNNL